MPMPRRFISLVAAAGLVTPGNAFAPHAAAIAPRWPVTDAKFVAPRSLPPLATVGTTPESDQILDVGGMGRYVFALLIQMTAVTTAFGFVDLACYSSFPWSEQPFGALPWQAVAGIFFALSLRSRVFSPLDNSRPEVRNLSGNTEPGTAAEDDQLDDEALQAYLVDVSKTRLKELQRECERRGLATDNTMDRVELARRLQLYLDNAASAPAEAVERLMPSWTPPGVTFPIMWVLVVAPLRAASASLIYSEATGRLNEAHLNDPVLLWLVFHLCIGDTWNTVNNVERRTGAAVPGVVLVWLSTLYAARQFWDVSPLAGGLLGLTALWITVAGALVADTWRINNEVRPEPLYPYKRAGFKSPTRLSLESFEGFSV